MARVVLKQSMSEATERSWHNLTRHFGHTNHRGRRIPFVPLFMDEKGAGAAPETMDVCAISLAITAMSQRGELDFEELATLEELTAYLLLVRDKDGSWPSLVYLEAAADVEEMEGVVNEVYWALRALLDVGLPDIDRTTLKLSFDAQLTVLAETISWLERNRVGHAWWYTGTSLAQDPGSLVPAVLPTAHVVIVLRQLEDSVEQSKRRLMRQSVADRPRFESDLSVIAERTRKLRVDALAWLRSFPNEDGGYGTQAGEKSNVTDTAAVLVALCTDDSSENLCVARAALKYLLKRKVGGRQPIDESELFVQYDQIRSFGDGAAAIVRRRPINHEKPLEPGVLIALVRSLEKKWPDGGKTLYGTLRPLGKWSFRRRFGSVSRALLKREVRQGSLAGAFRGHRQTSMHFPVYYSVDSITALRGAIPHAEVAARVVTLGQIVAAVAFLFVVTGAVAGAIAYGKDAAVSVITGIVLLVLGWIGVALWDYFGRGD